MYKPCDIGFSSFSSYFVDYTRSINFHSTQFLLWNRVWIVLNVFTIFVLLQINIAMFIIHNTFMSNQITLTPKSILPLYFSHTPQVLFLSGFQIQYWISLISLFHPHRTLIDITMVRKCEFISNLLNPILLIILRLFVTKEVVRTCVLSKRWDNCWPLYSSST